MDEHKSEITELEARAFDVHCEISSTAHIRTKELLMAKKADIDRKLAELRSHRDIEEEKQYAEKLDTLIKENRLFISFAVNTERIPIDEKGKVQVTFKPCNHRKTFTITELRLSQMGNNRTKFETWVRILKSNIIHSGAMRCEECRKNKEKRFQTLRRYTHATPPQLNWELHALR